MQIESRAIEISRPQWSRRAVVVLVSVELLLAASLPIFARISRDAFVNLFFIAVGGACVCAAAFGIAMRPSALGRRNDGANGSLSVHGDLVTVDAGSLQLSIPRARIVGSAITQHGPELDLSLLLDDESRVTARVDDLQDARAYRSNVTVDDLLASLAPQEAPEARLAAAVALASEPEHIDEAIAATANPRVRIALERAADGTLDDAMLLAASKDEG